jgi:hypothetical protein
LVPDCDSHAFEQVTRGSSAVLGEKMGEEKPARNFEKSRGTTLNSPDGD